MSRPTWRQHLKTRGRDYVISAIIIAFAISGLMWTTREARTVYRSLQSADDWVTYHSVEFVGENPEGRGGLGSLTMRSDTTIHRSAHLRYLDILMCREIGSTDDYQRVSQNLDSASFVAEARPRSQTDWPYLADYPYDHDCIVSSVVYATVDGVEKVILVDSAPFVVERLS